MRPALEVLDAHCRHGITGRPVISIGPWFVYFAATVR
jgi:hypothetical protein